jgi:hypothetical protein
VGVAGEVKLPLTGIALTVAAHLALLGKTARHATYVLFLTSFTEGVFSTSGSCVYLHYISKTL